MINNLSKNFYELLPAKPKTIFDKSKLFRLDLAEGFFLPSPEVYKVLKGIKEEAISTLPDRNSISLKTALGRFLDIDNTYLSVFSGSDEIIEIIPRIFLNPGDTALVITPTFQRMIATNFKVGATVSLVPTSSKNSFCLTDKDLKLVKKLLKQRVKVVWLCTPNNPTGAVCDKNVILPLIKVFPKTLFVINEVYQEYYSLNPKNSFVGYTYELKNLIVIRSFSKAFGLAGVRVGYLVANPGLVSNVEKFRTMYNLSAVSQELAIAALGDINYVKKITSAVKNERDRVIREIQKRNKEIEIIDKSRTNLVFLRHKSLDLFKELIKRGYVASDWREARGTEGQGFVRISVGSKEYNDRVIEVLSKI